MSLANAPATSIGPMPAIEPESVPFRLTADDYFRLVESGIIPGDRRVWLWGGYLYEKMAKKQAHAVSTSKVTTALGKVLPDGWCLWPENPVEVAPDKVPLPDLSLVRGSADDYRDRRAAASDVGLIIEIADTTIRDDLGLKLEQYARASIPEYWVINLVAHRVEAYSRPALHEGQGVYEAVEYFGSHDDVPLRLEGRAVARVPVRALLPR
jgi:Uma2 family endonuclease